MRMLNFNQAEGSRGLKVVEALNCGSLVCVDLISLICSTGVLALTLPGIFRSHSLTHLAWLDINRWNRMGGPIPDM